MPESALLLTSLDSSWEAKISNCKSCEHMFPSFPTRKQSNLPIVFVAVSRIGNCFHTKNKWRRNFIAKTVHIPMLTVFTLSSFNATLRLSRKDGKSGLRYSVDGLCKEMEDNVRKDPCLTNQVADLVKPTSPCSRFWNSLSSMYW